MKTTLVKELMVPVESYATVSRDATLYEAVDTLEKAQGTLDPARHKYRAILVLDEDGSVMGKITMKDILMALEPNYKNLGGVEVLSSSGHSPDLIKSMLEENALWLDPFQFICERAATMKVGDFVKPPDTDGIIDENASLAEAIHQLIMFPPISLLVKKNDAVVGVLRLSDVFAKICNKIKACEI
jgi:predicted transcriptional regulator